jgi:hypothetical protein
VEQREADVLFEPARLELTVCDFSGEIRVELLVERMDEGRHDSMEQSHDE